MGIRHKNSKWKLEKFTIPQELLQEGQYKKPKDKSKKDSAETVVQPLQKIATIQQIAQNQTTEQVKNEDSKQGGIRP